MVADVPPPVAFTVIVRVVRVARLVALTVMIVDPAEESELGEKDTDSPLPKPLAVKLTLPVVVPLSVIVVLAEEPRDTEIEFGEAEIV